MEKIEFITKAEAAEILRVSETTVERLIASGQLPAYRIARACTRIDKADLLEYVRGRAAKTSALQKKTRARRPSQTRYAAGDHVYKPGMKVVDPYG